MKIQGKIYELGDDGRLVRIQLEELIGGLEREEELIIKDYLVIGKKRERTPEKIITELEKLSYEDLSKQTTIARLLGYENFENYEEVGVYTEDIES